MSTVNIYICGTWQNITCCTLTGWVLEIPCKTSAFHVIKKEVCWCFEDYSLGLAFQHVSIPLGFLFLSPTRLSRGSCNHKCHIHGTQMSCPVCSNKPEVFYGDHTAAWLSLHHFPLEVTLYKWYCLQPQSVPTRTRYASAWVWCQTWWCRWGTDIYQNWLCCPSTYWCISDRKCDHREWLQGFWNVPGRWHRSSLNFEHPFLSTSMEKRGNNQD